MAEEDFVPLARLSQHRKDVRTILGVAERKGLTLPLSQVHYQILTSAVEAGDGELDNSVIIRQVRRMQKNG